MWSPGISSRKEQSRRAQALLGGTRARRPNIFTDHLPHSIQGHDHEVKQPGVRGEKTDGDHRLPAPAPSLQTCFRRRSSEKAGFRGQRFYKHSLRGPVEVCVVGERSPSNKVLLNLPLVVVILHAYINHAPWNGPIHIHWVAPQGRLELELLGQ